jgi:hypothetical protein
MDTALGYDLNCGLKFRDFAKNPFSFFQHFEAWRNVPPPPIDPNNPPLLKSLCKMDEWHSLCFYQMQAARGGHLRN